MCILHWTNFAIHKDETFRSEWVQSEKHMYDQIYKTIFIAQAELEKVHEKLALFFLQLFFKPTLWEDTFPISGWNFRKIPQFADDS